MIDVADIIVSLPSHGRPTYTVTADGFDALVEERQHLRGQALAEAVAFLRDRAPRLPLEARVAVSLAADALERKLK